ncbi:three-finger toxin MicTx3-like [Megalobrama amblycephala]|uniref:three-finger toxin MicTx3-like n=1 Tax=Megalobrama amblycephala TaxID=75352 RepID=UPI0020145BDB|nr:three-finger toxin MicTx3-like [Megalobrama amblycephala]
MDLRVSVVLLFIFLTGGYSLKCYTCVPDSWGYCETTVETCPYGHTTCATVKQSVGFTITKMCTFVCLPGSQHQPNKGTVSIQCCDTDLCNAADGVFKGSFLLLFSPLLFYFLFQ